MHGGLASTRPQLARRHAPAQFRMVEDGTRTTIKTSSLCAKCMRLRLRWQGTKVLLKGVAGEIVPRTEMAERVGFLTPPFPKPFRVRDMPKNAVFTGILVVSQLAHPSQKNLLLTIVSRFTVWMVWMAELLRLQHSPQTQTSSLAFTFPHIHRSIPTTEFGLGQWLAAIMDIGSRTGRVVTGVEG